MDNKCLTVYTAWVQDSDCERSYYAIPVLTLYGGEPFEDQTFLLKNAGKTDEGESRKYFEKNEVIPEAIEDSWYSIYDFNVSAEVLAEYESKLILTT